MTHIVGATFQLDYDDFLAVDIRVGTVIAAEPLSGSRKPALALRIDFGPEVGVRRSSAQITRHYTPEVIIGRQVMAVVNFAPKRVAGYVSEVLVLGVPDESDAIVLVAPDGPVPNGKRLF